MTAHFPAPLPGRPRLLLLFAAVGIAAVTAGRSPAQATTGDATAGGATTGDATAGGATARQIDLRGANFRGTDLRGASFAGADVAGAVFLRADVTGATFWRARLDDTDLRGVVGLTRGQLAAARWDPRHPPRLDSALHAFRRFWDRRRMAGQDLRGANWWNADLAGFDFTGADLRGSVLIGADLRGARLQRADLTGTLLVGADLGSADLRGVRGLGAGQLLSARWAAEHPPLLADALRVMVKRFAKKRLVGETLRRADLWNRDLRGFDFTGADLRGASLIGADLEGAVLRDAKLDGVVWSGANLTAVDLRGGEAVTPAMLAAARWDPKRPPMLGEALNLERKRLEKKFLHGERLGGANLWSADLRGADLSGASLRDTVMVEADLRAARLQDADLTGANLTRADISGADFRGVKGLSVGAFLAARWSPRKPPVVGEALALFVRLWSARDMHRRSLRGACVWDTSLDGARFRGADLADVTFVRASLRGADLRDAELLGAEFLGADLTGADFRGARHVTAKMIVAARWDPARPPAFDRGFNALRIFAEKKRFEFDLRGAALHGPDPAGVMGPVRRGDEVARFSVQAPPRLGMARLVELIRERRLRSLRIDP